MKQQSEEWHEARLGMITGSRFGSLMVNGKGKDGLGRGAITYAYELMSEILTGEAKILEGVALDHGNKYEPYAKLEYEVIKGVEIEEVGFLGHPDIEGVGGSPDGLVEKDGLIEIKCPYNPVEHLKYISEGKLPNSYIAQIQGYLWITDRKWCDFITYDPRINDSKFRMKVIRFDRDDDYIKKLEKKVKALKNYLNNLLNKKDAKAKKL